MQTPEQAFRRWRERGDPDDLAVVFDATATDLLRLAFHLCGSLVDAEDLLQTTFLEAMRGAATWRDDAPLVPWLTGILRRQAASNRRREARGRQIVAVRDVREDVVDAAELAERRERSEVLVGAVEALDEPYRSAMLLQARHGLSSTEIADVLGRAPGTVRVQLHRATELLRTRLPEGVLALTPYVLEPVRGVVAVREAVVAQAPTFVAPVAGASTLGGAGVAWSARVAVLLAAIVVGTAVVRFVLGPDARATNEPARVALEEGARGAANPALEVAGVAGSSRSTNASIAPEDATSSDVRLLLLDGTVDTAVGVAGARVEVYPAPLRSLFEFAERWQDQLALDPWGRPGSGYEGLAFPEDVSDAVLFEGERVPVIEPPAPGTRPRFVTVSDEDGLVRLPAAPEGGVLVVEAEGFGRRVLGVPADRATLRLYANRSFSGRIVTVDGEVPPVGLELEFEATGSFPSLGAWPFHAGTGGRFEFEAAAQAGRVRVRTPGWHVDAWGLHPERREPITSEASLEPDAESLVFVRHRPSQILEVVDGASKAPVERVAALLLNSNDEALLCGWFPAPDGRLDLARAFGQKLSFRGTAGGEMLLGNYELESLERELSLWLWTPGRVAGPSREPLLAEGTRTVALLPARTAFEGRVLRAGEPVEGARVRLLTWTPDPSQNATPAVARVLTDADGTFRLDGPAARLLLVVEAGASIVRLPVTGASAEPLVVELDAVGHLDVAVLTHEGSPSEDHHVVLRTPGSGSRTGTTDHRGIARFANLPAGDYAVVLASNPDRHALRFDVNRGVRVEAGATTREDIVLAPRPTGVRVRLAFEGGATPADLEAWTVTAYTPIATEPRAVLANGSVQGEFERGNRFVVQGIGDRRWTDRVPKDAGDEYESSLALDGPGVRGRLLVRESGRPIAGCRVFVVASSGTESTSLVTDAAGWFEARGLRRGIDYHLEFNESANAPFSHWGSNRWSRLRFLPSDPQAALEPEDWVVEFPEAQFDAAREVEVELTLEDLSGAPAEGVRAEIATYLETVAGRLEIVGPSGATDAEGRVVLKGQRGDAMALRASYGGVPGVADREGLEGTFHWNRYRGRARVR